MSTDELRNELQARNDEVKQLLNMIKERDKELNELRNKVSILTLGLEQMHEPRRHRGIGISAEPPTKTGSSSVAQHPKGISTKALLKEAILDNYFMKHLEENQIDQIVSAMENKDYRKDSIIIQEGDDGSHVYIIEDGVVEVSKGGQVLTELKDGKVFGELAVLYNCKRQATVKALTRVSLWALSRRDYQTIMTYSGLRLHQQCVKFLLSVPVIKTLQPEFISKIADAAEEIRFSNGDYIIRQGEIGNSFYIITEGQVKVTQTKPGEATETPLTTLKVGEYFGERAIESEDLRAANVIADHIKGVSCLVLSRNEYKRLIATSLWVSPAKPSKEELTEEDKLLANVKLTDFVTIATLGVGGFGRVELVHAKNDKNKSYALKKMKKKFIVDMQQQDHVMQERGLLKEMRCRFIVRLYRTYKDDRFLYLLMECCLGGELWTLMRNRRSFSENEARFFVSCVSEAYNYMHSRGIIYRDLKPENLILDVNGYAKLVDFGFAKRIGHSGEKTWTFCGTPEYVAPEVILNKGHDFGADLWSLGILVYELINGSPPFNGNDHLTTYNLILRGIDSIDFSKKIGRTAKSLIKKLCRDLPAERLGYGSKGMLKLQKHKWFDGFDWEGLRQGTLKAPIIPKAIKNALDSGNFDSFPADDESDAAPDTTGWDKDF
jgi:cGMP-dependent protein kinase